MTQVPMTILQAHQMEHQALRSAGLAGFPIPARNFPTKPIAIPSVSRPRGSFSLHGMGDVYGLTFLGDVGPVDPNTPVTYGVLQQALSDAQQRQLIYAAVGGIALVGLGGVVTYFITRR